MATSIDTKQIAERVKRIRYEQEHYFPQQPNEPTEVELCGYVEPSPCRVNPNNPR